MAFSIVRELSIHQRLLILTMLTSAIGMLLGSIGYLTYDLHVERQEKMQEIQSLADLIATNAAAALAFDDAAGGAKLVTYEESNMNKSNSSPEIAGVDLSELLARVDNDRELLCDLLSIFKYEFPDHLQALRNAVAGNAAAEVARISHTLKGMLANLAVTKAADSASRLERLARAAEIASLGDALAAFEKEVQGLLPEMESYMAEARP